MKKLLIFTGAIAVLLVGIFTFRTYFSTSLPSNRVVLQTITNQYPEFLSNNKPVIQVESVSRFEDEWYIITLKSLNEVEQFVPVKALLTETPHTSTGLKIVLGPEVHFTESEMRYYNLPDTVIKELQK